MAWVQATRLSASDGQMNDFLGSSVVLSGTSALVGAPGRGFGQGVVYAFTGQGPSWGTPQELTASDGALSDAFGTSLALSGTTAVVGANYKSSQTGAAYVFTQSGTWAQQAELLASDGAAGDGFGIAVALSGGTLLVGANQNGALTTTSLGAVYVFTGSGGTWTQTQKLTASDGAVGDELGAAVALSGTVALVGARSKTVGANAKQGAVYVLTLQGSTWTQQQELTAADGAAGDAFGGAIALSGTTAIIGAAGKGTGVSSGRGSAYVFTQSGGTWTQAQELTPSNGNGGDGFGTSVALSGTNAIVGASGKSFGGRVGQGAAYVFASSGGTWSQQPMLTASDGLASDGFGDAVAIDGLQALVGASGKQVSGNNSAGVVYVEAYGQPNGSACGSPSACPTGFCVDGVCCDAACNGICEACVASLQQGGTDGTCAPVKVGTNPHHDPCGPDPVASCGHTGVCDGKGACQDYASGTACSSSCSGNQLTSGACNGTGTCVPTKTTCPGGFACGATGACNTACTTSADCVTGHVCKSSTCVAMVASVCSSDGTKVVDGQGHETDCAPYLCAKGACLTSCTTAAQCAPPSVCSSSHVCTTAAAAGSGGSSGSGSSGGCAIGDGEGTSAPFAWGLALVAADVARRMRARRAVKGRLR